MTAGRKQPRTWTGKPPEGTNQTALGAAPGTFLSDFALPNLDGHVVRISDQLGHPYIFLFVDQICGPSSDVLRELSRLKRKPHSTIPQVIIAYAGEPARARALASEHDIGPDIVVQERQELSTFYRIPATPAAYFVDETRRTVGNLAIGKHAVIGLLRGKRVQKGKQIRPGDSTPVSKPGRGQLGAGDMVPEIAVSALEGYSIALQALRGQRVLLLLWSDDCPFCNDILESAPGLPEELTVLVVGRDGDTKPAMAGTALFGTQERKDVFDALHLYQTPSAVLIDSAGRLERDPATGWKAVSQLMVSLRR